MKTCPIHKERRDKNCLCCYAVVLEENETLRASNKRLLKIISNQRNANKARKRDRIPGL